MRVHNVGQSVPQGVYLSLRPLDVQHVGADGESLEGPAGARYRRLPTLLLAALSPLFGAVFVMAFPFVVFGAIAWVAVRKVTSLVRHEAREHAYLVRPGFQPQASYLDHPDKEPTTGATDEELEDLADRVDAQRRDEQKPGDPT
ncbi:MAG: hypothetical protein IT371_09800 [Deltaproteobacteria bacterium]|nr:hypothetical protein [Deltaproteobacteria bacterium]